MTQDKTDTSRLHRRSVLKSAAWSVPVVAASTLVAPAAHASGTTTRTLLVDSTCPSQGTTGGAPLNFHLRNDTPPFATPAIPAGTQFRFTIENLPQEPPVDPPHDPVVLPTINLNAGYSEADFPSTRPDDYTQIFTVADDYTTLRDIYFNTYPSTLWTPDGANWQLRLTVVLPGGYGFDAGSVPTVAINKVDAQCYYNVE